LAKADAKIQQLYETAKENGILMVKKEKEPFKLWVRTDVSG
jgi:hypothetical protein